MNNVQVLGFIAGDAQQKQTRNGAPFYVFSVADNVSKDKTLWWQITVFDVQRFEKIIPHLKKGTAIVINGRLSTANAFSKASGDLGVNLTVVPDTIKFSPFNKREENQQGQQQPQQQMQP